MSVTVINPSGSQNYQAILSCERFQEFAAVYEERTGRKPVLELNKDGERISWIHPESTQRLGFFVDFFRVGIQSPVGFEATIENLVRRLNANRPVYLSSYGLPGTTGKIGGHAVVGFGTRNEGNGSFTVRVNYGWGNTAVISGGASVGSRTANDVWITGFNWRGLLTFTITP